MVEPRKVAPRADNASPHAGAQGRLAARVLGSHRRARRRRPRVGFAAAAPAPFGLARNGAVVYGSTDGDIYAYDPATGASTAIITGATGDETPDFAPNGSTFVFARATDQPEEYSLLMLADADGKNIRPLTGAINPKFNDWSKDSTRLAVVDASGRCRQAVGLRRRWVGSHSILPAGMDAIDQVQWRSDSELVFLGTKDGSHGLDVIALDGKAPRAVLPPTEADNDWMDPVVSPDGTRIVYTKWVNGQTIRIVDIDTGKDVAPVFDGTNEGDGWPTRAARRHEARVQPMDRQGELSRGRLCQRRRRLEMGPRFADFTNGAVGRFSPDGAKILAHYGFDDAATWLLDPAGGPASVCRPTSTSRSPGQRLAP